MRIQACRWLIVALSTVAFVAPAAAAQPPPALPPAPVPAVAPPPPVGPIPPTLGQPIPAPPPYAPPPSPPPPTGPFAPADPGRDGWLDGSLPERLFFNAELQFLAPAIKNRLVGTVVFPNGDTSTLNVPAADLDFTVSPVLEVGYRLPDSAGEFIFRYRFLVDEGTGTAISTTDGEQFAIRSRLDLNQFDFDYAAARYSPYPFLDLKWRIGARLATVFFDTRIQNDFQEQQSSNYFVGAGPHAAVEIERHFPVVPGLSAFVGLDGAVVIGQVKQRFHQTFFLADGDFRGDLQQQKTQSVPVLTVRAGVAYTPPRLEYLHFSTGYQFERWWNLGKFNGSSGELTDQGVFLRAEIDY
jgi:hypothetical protein